MENDMVDLPEGALRQAGIKMLREAAALVVAMSVLSAAAWYAVEPRVEEWVGEKVMPISREVSRLEGVVSRVERQVNSLPRPHILDFRGSGQVAAVGPFRAGSHVPITYLLRRNLNCRTIIEVNFISARRGTVVSAYTYTVPATRAPITLDFNPFTIDVKLPDDMQPGRYSYSARVINDDDSAECVGLPPKASPISEFFEVVNG